MSMIRRRVDEAVLRMPCAAAAVILLVSSMTAVSKRVATSSGFGYSDRHEKVRESGWCLG